MQIQRARVIISKAHTPTLFRVSETGNFIDEWITPPASFQDDEWEKFVKTAVRVCVVCV